MSEEIKWIKVMSNSDENRILKTHGYIDDGYGGNVSLCGKMHIGEPDWGRVERFSKLTNDNVETNRCKLCTFKKNPTNENRQRTSG
jgi:hypothetical protein